MEKEKKEKKEKWYTVRNGEILFTGTRRQCERLADSILGAEVYPESARIRKE